MRVVSRLLITLFIVSCPAIAEMPDVDIPFDRFTLDNGLTVIVHEDRKVPIVAVSLWYGVGSKDEPQGKTGFAHLFEHLMFNGSGNYDDDYQKPFEQVGATGMNGTTWFDRTNYFATVPTPALDMALWMESDRMTHMLAAVTQEKLDEQRAVVQNEKRQGDNQPYGLVGYQQLRALFPEGHPYAHSTIGSMEDLEAASLEMVHEWFKQYYGASNAVLVLAGDINLEEAKPLVQKYFGDAPVGTAVPKMKEWVPDRKYNTFEQMRDLVPQARIYRDWVVPGLNSVTAAELELAAYVLGNGKNSRLYKELVYERQIATDVAVYLQEFLLASFFAIEVTLKTDADIDEASAVIDDLIADFLKNGPRRDELDLAKTKMNAQTVRGLEQIGGFTGKAVTLAKGELYSDDPGFWKTRLGWLNDANSNEVRAAAREWLNTGYHQINVIPFGELSSSEEGADRSQLPVVDKTPDLKWPEVETAKLDNGIEVVFVNRDAVPVVEVALVFDAGYASDRAAGGKLGLANLTMSMLDEGAGGMGALEIAEEAESLGAIIATDADLDSSMVMLSAMKSTFKESLDLMSEIVRSPDFPSDELERVRRIHLAEIQQEMAQPIPMALRTIPPLIYGDEHAYGVPFTGSGDAESLAAITRDDLVEYQQTWLRPDNSTLFVVGDISLEEALPEFEAAFGSWRVPAGDLPEKPLFDVPKPEGSRIILIDRPGSPQSAIFAGLVGPKGNSDGIELSEMSNEPLGGSFTSRVNMNLREDKGWAYGAFTLFLGAREQRPFIVFAPVQTDKTAESVHELLLEMNGYIGDKPATEEELTKIVNNNVRSLPGQFEKSTAILNSLIDSSSLNRPWNYPESLKSLYEGMTVSELQKAAQQVIHPDELLWVIVGDVDKIEEPLRAMGLGEVEVR